MQFLKHIRILPVFIFVAFLSFSLRFVDVAQNIGTLTSAAQAADDEQGMAQDKEMDEHGDMSTQSGEDMAQSHAADEHSEENAEDGALVFEEGDESDWQDATYDDLGYQKVRSDLFEDLVTRREGLEKREQDLVTREALLIAAEKELDRKYQELSQLRGEIEKLLEKQGEEEQGRVQSLVKIYEGMKPKEAARIFDTLDLDVLLSVVSNMSERRLSPILANMNPERARTVTIMLAEQKQLPTLEER